jgi:hypothetical protein
MPKLAPYKVSYIHMLWVHAYIILEIRLNKPLFIVYSIIDYNDTTTNEHPRKC